MLFLGAGASKPLGIPTMREFTDVILNELNSRAKSQTQKNIIRDYLPHLQEIQSDVSGFGWEPDIESILSVLEARAEPRRALENIGPMITLYSKRRANISADSKAEQVIREIEDIIYEKCMNDLNHDLAVRYYSDLWETMSRNIRLLDEKGHSYSMANGDILIREVFTTNYDLAIETFLKQRRIHYDDGYDKDPERDLSFTSQWRDNSVNLFKLHGSINYYVRTNGKVIQSDTEISEKDFYGRKVERMMIYPAGAKYTSQWPYYEYLLQLRRALIESRLCVVIGYSFRDPAIMNAFLDVIQRRPDLRIFLVSPSAENIHSYLPRDLRKQVHPIPANFGDPSMPDIIMQEAARWKME